MCVHLCGLWAEECQCLQRPVVSDPLELELIGVVGSLMCMLGTELRFLCNSDKCSLQLSHFF